MKYKIKDIAFVSAGQSAPQGERMYSEDGTPFVKAGNLEDLSINNNLELYCQKVPQTTVEICKLKLYPKNSILFAKSGMSCMKGYVVEILEPAYVVSHLAIISPKEDVCNSKYLKFYYTFNKPQKLIKDVAYPSISLADIQEETIDLPPLDKQQEIVSILDKINNVIEADKKQLELLDEAIKSRFLEIFGDPESNPLNFEKVKFAELGELARGKSKHRPRNDAALLGGPYPLIQTGDVTSSQLYIRNYSSTYSELGLKQSKMWSKGTLCITIAANIADSAILTFDSCFPDSVVGFIPNEDVNVLFVKYQLDLLKEYFDSKATAVAQKNLNLEKLSSALFIKPLLKQQNEFASFVEHTYKMKIHIQQHLNLMQELLTKKMRDFYGGVDE